MLVAENLESRWLSISAPSRRAHLLEGIVRTCRMDGIEQQRLFANEVTVSNMERNGGMVFLRVLKDAVLDDSTSVPTTPKLLSNPRFEKLITTKRKGSSDNARIIQETFKVTRNLVICKLHALVTSGYDTHML